MNFPVPQPGVMDVRTLAIMKSNLEWVDPAVKAAFDNPDDFDWSEPNRYELAINECLDLGAITMPGATPRDRDIFLMIANLPGIPSIQFSFFGGGLKLTRMGEETGHVAKKCLACNKLVYERKIDARLRNIDGSYHVCKMECLECKVPVHYVKGNDGYERLCNVDGSFHICEVVNRILDEFIQENSKLLGELAKGSK